MKEVVFHKGHEIIKQGDDGDVLYLVDQGELECFRLINGKNTFLRTYSPGEAFGELALLYNSPRAATIIAKTKSVCFTLDRECFNDIVKEGSVKKR